jgi:hypothetical protein
LAIKVLSDKDSHATRQLLVLQIVVICFSVVFLFILYNGWNGLFSHSGAVLEYLGAGLLALLAWGLGQYIGNSDGGIGTKAPLFAMLLIISAAGVFNWMMIHLEGKTIFLETVSNASDAYTKLETSAKQNVGDTALAAKEADVKSKEEQFLAEVRNPQNCGFGTNAKQRLAELRFVLPGLNLPSEPRRSRAALVPEACSARADLYRSAIDQQWNSSDDGKKLDNVGKLLVAVTGTIDEEIAKLDAMRTRANTSGADYILGEGRDDLNTANETYKKLLGEVATYAPNSGLQPNLDLTSISRLGEWSQIVSVITSRLDQVSTYVYLALAIFMDFMLIYVFREYRNVRRGQPKQIVATDNKIRHLTPGAR